MSSMTTNQLAKALIILDQEIRWGKIIRRYWGSECGDHCILASLAPSLGAQYTDPDQRLWQLALEFPSDILPPWLATTLPAMADNASLEGWERLPRQICEALKKCAGWDERTWRARYCGIAGGLVGYDEAAWRRAMYRVGAALVALVGYDKGCGVRGQKEATVEAVALIHRLASGEAVPPKKVDFAILSARTMATWEVYLALDGQIRKCAETVAKSAGWDAVNAAILSALTTA